MAEAEDGCDVSVGGILFAKPGEYLACDVCNSRIEDKDVAEMGKNHDAEAYWCSQCIDFVGIEVRKI